MKTKGPSSGMKLLYLCQEEAGIKEKIKETNYHLSLRKKDRNRIIASTPKDQAPVHFTGFTQDLEKLKEKLLLLERKVIKNTGSITGEDFLEVLESFNYFLDSEKKKLKKLNATEMVQFVRSRKLLENSILKMIESNFLATHSDRLRQIMNVFFLSFPVEGLFSNLIPFIIGLAKHIIKVESSDSTLMCNELRTLCLSAAAALKNSKEIHIILKAEYKRKLFFLYRSLSSHLSSNDHKNMLEILFHLVEEHCEDFWFHLIYVVLRCKDTMGSETQQAVLKSLRVHDKKAESMIHDYFLNNLEQLLNCKTENYRLLFIQAWVRSENNEVECSARLAERAALAVEENFLVAENEFQVEYIRILLAVDDNCDNLNKLKHQAKKLISSKYFWLAGDIKRLRKYDLEIQQRLSALPTLKDGLIVECMEDSIHDHLSLEKSEQALPVKLTYLAENRDPLEIINQDLVNLRARHSENKLESWKPDNSYLVVSANEKSAPKTQPPKQERRTSSESTAATNVTAQNSYVEFTPAPLQLSEYGEKNDENYVPHVKNEQLPTNIKSSDFKDDESESSRENVYIEVKAKKRKHPHEVSTREELSCYTGILEMNKKYDASDDFNNTINNKQVQAIIDKYPRNFSILHEAGWWYLQSENTQKSKKLQLKGLQIAFGLPHPFHTPANPQDEERVLSQVVNQLKLFLSRGKERARLDFESESEAQLDFQKKSRIIAAFLSAYAHHLAIDHPEKSNIYRRWADRLDSRRGNRAGRNTNPETTKLKLINQKIL